MKNEIFVDIFEKLTVRLYHALKGLGSLQCEWLCD